MLDCLRLWLNFQRDRRFGVELGGFRLDRHTFHDGLWFRLLYDKDRLGFGLRRRRDFLLRLSNSGFAWRLSYRGLFQHGFLSIHYFLRNRFPFVG